MITKHTNWYVRELSKLTDVSVRTLHHYDALGLLVPSIRLENGYRLYSEGDLMRLQRIVALKFFGFKLNDIRKLLMTDGSLMDHLHLQSVFLDQKAKDLMEASKTLKSIIGQCGESQTIPWQTVIHLIEVYKMTQELEKTWAGRALNHQEMDAFARFHQDLKKRMGEQEIEKIEQAWWDLVQSIEKHLDEDPAGPVGREVARTCAKLMNRKFAPQYRHLKHMVWEKAVKSGELGLSPAVATWLDKASEAYYRDRIHCLLNKVGTTPSSILEQLWNDLMEEMYGDSKPLRQEVHEAVYTDKDISPEAKAWVKSLNS